MVAGTAMMWQALGGFKMKYKIGDLVTLSAAGRARDGNWSCRNGFGVILHTTGEVNPKWPIKCHWPLKDCETKIQFFKPYELKRLKPDKKCPRQ